MDSISIESLSRDATTLTQNPALNPDDYDNTARALLARIRKAKPDESTALQILDTAQPGSLSIVYIPALGNLISAAKKSNRNVPAALLPEGKLWPAITRALLEFDPIQVRYVGAAFVDIVDTVAAGAEQTENYIPAIQLLQNAILRLDPTSSTLSTTHYRYVRLCLLARAYDEAKTILNLPISHIPTSESTNAVEVRPDANGPAEGRLLRLLCMPAESSVSYINQKTGLSGQITASMYMEYFMMAGMAYIALEDYKQAQAFLEVVLTTPSVQNAVSRIQVEAYKKWMLLSFIVNGKSRPTPKSIPNSALKSLRALSKPYECVCDAFQNGTADRLMAEVQVGEKFWSEDMNTGLVSELIAAYQKFAIMNLQKIFAAVSLEEIANRTSTSPKDIQTTTRLVQNLINSGALQAQLVLSQTGGAGMLRFLPTSTSQRSEAQITEELAVRMVELRRLAKFVSDYDHQLELNKDYLNFLLTTKKARDTSKKNSATTDKDNTYFRPTRDDDEDMMGDW